jgi:hypothetical protein
MIRVLFFMSFILVVGGCGGSSFDDNIPLFPGSSPGPENANVDLDHVYQNGYRVGASRDEVIQYYNNLNFDGFTVSHQDGRGILQLTGSADQNQGLIYTITVHSVESGAIYMINRIDSRVKKVSN